MINETRLDSVISELRQELDRIDRAILVFEKMASAIRTRKSKAVNLGPIRLRRTLGSSSRHSSPPPS